MWLVSKWNRRRGVDGPIAQTFLYVVILINMILVFMPLYLTIVMSLKDNNQLMAPIWTLPTQPVWSNYSAGFNEMALNLMNSAIISTVSAVALVMLSSLVAYVFARFEFPCKEFAFLMMIALMVIPGILTLTPQYILFDQLGMKNSWFALFIPYVVGGQPGAVFLFRAFFGQQPKELFEAAAIDGASHMRMYVQICIPLAVPIMVIQALGSFGGFYNDYLWPSLIIDRNEIQTLMPRLKAMTQTLVGQSGNNGGVAYALYMLSGIPLIITTVIGLKYFISGEFAAGMKL